jgi:hypothetical protein
MGAGYGSLFTLIPACMTSEIGGGEMGVKSGGGGVAGRFFKKSLQDFEAVVV